MPLSAYLAGGLSYQPGEHAPFPSFTDTAPDGLSFFDHLGQAMGWFLPVSADRADAIVAGFRGIGLTVAHSVGDRLNL
jgi:hypothetical protein